jgi:hypothetical protein
MKPTPKSKEIDKALKSMFEVDRKGSIKSNHCVAPPIGCGKEIDPDKEFTDTLSREEYRISGLCQTCQNHAFNS